MGSRAVCGHSTVRTFGHEVRTEGHPKSPFSHEKSAPLAEASTRGSPRPFTGVVQSNRRTSMRLSKRWALSTVGRDLRHHGQDRQAGRGQGPCHWGSPQNRGARRPQLRRRGRHHSPHMCGAWPRYESVLSLTGKKAGPLVLLACCTTTNLAVRRGAGKPL
jgi:hypothetical protein